MVSELLVMFVERRVWAETATHLHGLIGLVIEKRLDLLGGVLFRRADVRRSEPDHLSLRRPEIVIQPQRRHRPASCGGQHLLNQVGSRTPGTRRPRSRLGDAASS